MSATAASTFQLGDIFLEFGSQRLYHQLKQLLLGLTLLACVGKSGLDTDFDRLSGFAPG